MAVIYKTSQAQAQQMAEQFYNLAGPAILQGLSPAATTQAIDHWATQIQQDGSHTAFLNFAQSIADQHGQGAANTLTQNVQAATQATGLAPWQPSAGQPQLPGTNTKSGGAEIGTALTSPVGKVIEGVVAGVLDVVSDGALTPLTTAGLVALQGGGTALQPGNNAGTIASGALGGLGEGVAVGGVSSMLNSAGVGAPTSQSGTVMPDGSVLPAGVNPNTLNPGEGQGAYPGDPSQEAPAVTSPGSVPGPASGGTGGAGSGTSGIPGLSSLPGLASVAGLANGGSSGGGLGSVLSGVGSFLTGNGGLNALAIAQGANAASLGQQAQQYATTAANDANSRWAQQAPLRSAGVAGMLAPSSPYTAPAIPGGNPFAPLPTTPLPAPNPLPPAPAPAAGSV